MDERQRRFARDQDQLAAFLEHHIGGALYQRARSAGAIAATVPIEQGQIDHSARAVRTRRRLGAAIGVGIHRDTRPVAAGGLTRSAASSPIADSVSNRRQPCDETINSVGTLMTRQQSSRRTAYGAPLAPVTPRTRGRSAALTTRACPAWVCGQWLLRCRRLGPRRKVLGHRAHRGARRRGASWSVYQ